MLTYTFTNIGSDSLYQHLYKCIKNDILQGKLGTGERLPSKRPFAKNLGISVITVENAYEQLIAEGYIYPIHQKIKILFCQNQLPLILQILPTTRRTARFSLLLYGQKPCEKF